MIGQVHIILTLKVTVFYVWPSFCVCSLKLQFQETYITPGRRQSKTLLTVDERGSKIARNSVFDCHLSPDWWQMAIKNSVSNDFWYTFVDSIDVFDCRLPGVYMPSRHMPSKNVSTSMWRTMWGPCRLLRMKFSHHMRRLLASKESSIAPIF